MATRGLTLSRLACGGVLAGAALVLGAPVAAAEPTVEVSATEGLAAGDSVTVSGVGFDPQAGYYVSTCVVGSSGPAGPTCVGGASMRENSVWVTNNPQAAGIGTPIAEDGSFTAELTVADAAEGVDCATDECAVTVFFDHRNGFGVVSETPVVFGAGPESPAAPTTTAAATEPAAEQASDETGGAAWWVAGGAAVVAVAGAAAFALRKRT